MDAVEFLKAKNRICKSRDKYSDYCWSCPIGNGSGGCQAGAFGNQRVTETELVQIVENWSKEHPIKTRQSEFLKLFPDAKLDNNGIVLIMPCHIEGRLRSSEMCEKMTSCPECRKAYWGEEVE